MRVNTLRIEADSCGISILIPQDPETEFDLRSCVYQKIPKIEDDGGLIPQDPETEA